MTYDIYGCTISLQTHSGGVSMKIAATYDNGQIFKQFGKCEKLKFYEVIDGAVVSTEIIDVVGSGHDVITAFLKNHDVKVLVCDDIGVGARMAVLNEDIELFRGRCGDADKHVYELLKGPLAYNPDVMCINDMTDTACL